MQDTQLDFTQWSKTTVLHPVAAAILIAMSLVLLFCKRRYAIWPIIVVACFIVASQRIVVGSLDFTLMRIIIIVGVVRVLLRGEFSRFRWNAMDTAVTAYVLLKILTAALGDFPPSDVIARLGGAIDSLGLYFTGRCVMRDWSDVFVTVRGFIWIGVPVAGFFLVEALTHKNVFSAFGYVGEVGMIRGGHYRAQAAFSHPIIAGVYWATLIPLMVARYFQGGRNARFEAVLGICAALLIVFACSSSTPVMAIVFGLMGAAIFPLRGSMRAIRWSLLIAFIAFQCLSDKPAWRLLVDIDAVGGSTGYYRYKLIDQAIKHIDLWWECGDSTGTSRWADDLGDATNNFVVIGLQGGIPLLTMLIVVLAIGFGSIGRAWRYAGTDRRYVIAAWALGVSLFMHIMSFFGVTYFGQAVMLWDLTLAMIGSIRPPAGRTARLASQNLVARRRRSGTYSDGARTPAPTAYSGK